MRICLAFLPLLLIQSALGQEDLVLPAEPCLEDPLIPIRSTVLLGMVDVGFDIEIGIVAEAAVDNPDHDRDGDGFRQVFVVRIEGEIGCGRTVGDAASMALGKLVSPVP